MDFEGISRRGFLTYLGWGTYELLRSSSALGAPFPLDRRPGRPPSFFKPIAASGMDQLLTPKGYRSDVVLTYGQELGSQGPRGSETFGYDNDFTAFFPIDALAGGSRSDEGLLWVNHENVKSLFVIDHDGKSTKTREQIEKEKMVVGGSITHLKRQEGKWKLVEGSKYNRRLTALYPEMELTGPAATKVGKAVGTLANCSGGVTPWDTVLTCEENYQDMNPEDGHGWGAYPETALKEEQYGWVVEVDPFGELPPVKHTSLGRFCHENAAVTVGATNRLVVYLGDDGADQCLYKFVSHGKYDAKAPRADRRKLLAEGTLYAADMANGKWIPLDIERTPELKKHGFRSQAEVLIEARKAAHAVKATPLDRPEDCEINPNDKSLYFTLTSNPKHGNLHGQIVRLVEKGDDPEAQSFRYEIFLAGGPQSGLSCPDNLVFDKQGNLWVTCDVSHRSLNRGAHELFMNNGLFIVPTRGPSAGDAFQFLSAPNEAELTGPSFTPDWKTVFVSVQHPGESSINANSPTSRWPDGGTSKPRPSVVAISGFRW